MAMLTVHEQNEPGYAALPPLSEAQCQAVLMAIVPALKRLTAGWHQSVETLECSTRAMNALRYNALRTIGAVLVLDDVEILRLPKAGPHVIAEVAASLRAAIGQAGAWGTLAAMPLASVMKHKAYFRWARRRPR